MDPLFALLSPAALLLCLAVALLAGVVKGMVGFAMPMIMISGMGSVVAPELAIAGLILPTLVTNGMQALRQGAGAAWASVRRFRVFLMVGGAMLLVSAQLVAALPAAVLYAMIGVPIILFAAAQLLGRGGALPDGGNRRLEVGLAALAGFTGGMSGVWGPPTVAYLTMIGTEKTEQIRVQGVIYGLGAVLLTGAHVGSGVLDGTTVRLSLALVPAAVLGMWIGGKVQDRIDQVAFRRATLVVLLVAGLNLVRRALLA